MRFPLALVVGTLAVPLTAQNALQHYDGTTEFTSRGAAGAGAKTLLQRIPMDQACGRSGIVDVVFVIQDQMAPTAEMYTIEVRANDPAGPPIGSPDMTPAGLLAAIGPVPILFPGAGVSAVSVTAAVGLVLPPFAGGTPFDDVYVGLAFPPAPAWPADGISLHMSAALGGMAGEQMNAAAIGYAGAAGDAGLGWDSPVGGPPAPGAGNRAWNMRTRFADDVLQPFADNVAVFLGAGGTGLNPNFGYAGIFPDVLRGDMVGWRALATGVPGEFAVLVLGAPSPPIPVPVPGVGGLLCLAPASLMTVGLAVYVPAPPGEPPTTVAATWGPLAVPPALAGLALFAQAASFKVGGGALLSTGCRTQM